MPYEIPVNSVPDREFDISLGDNVLTLRTYYNSTNPGWFLDISDASGVYLAQGLALVPGVNLLESSPYLTRILGQFRVLATDGSDVLGASDLGVIGRLFWFEPGEYEAAAPTPTAGVVPLPFVLTDLYHV